LATGTSDADWVLMNGAHIQIKRRLFEKVIDEIRQPDDVTLPVGELKELRQP